MYSYYGQALLRTGDPAGATDAFRKALDANPVRLHGESATRRPAEGGRENSEDARACLRRAMQVRPNDISGAVSARDDRDARGQTRAARRDLEAIVKEAPEVTRSARHARDGLLPVAAQDGGRPGARNRTEAQRRGAGETAAGSERQMIDGGAVDGPRLPTSAQPRGVRSVPSQRADRRRSPVGNGAGAVEAADSAILRAIRS